ncbi:MAG: hypothetical protein KDJ67_15975 [Nitratireductor sp.]|nr:hypothetical protein [Nitratireductor sp.]
MTLVKRAAGKSVCGPFLDEFPIFQTADFHDPRPGGSPNIATLSHIFSPFPAFLIPASTPRWAGFTFTKKEEQKNARYRVGKQLGTKSDFIGEQG